MVAKRMVGEEGYSTLLYTRVEKQEKQLTWIQE
jgi:hypothetical protein